MLYGAGVVAPGAANLTQLLEVIEKQEHLLVTEPDLDNAFLVGKPSFEFEAYRDWIVERNAPSKFSQLSEKGGENVQIAIGTTIDALKMNPGLEQALKKLDPRTLVCYGSGFGDLTHYFAANESFQNASQQWNRFWAHADRNKAFRDYSAGHYSGDDVPTDPTHLPADSYERMRAWAVWDAFWASKSDGRAGFLQELEAIERTAMGQDVGADKLNLIRTKAKAKKALLEKTQCPIPPWESVSPNFLWNLPNAPAAQVSMLLGIHGVSSASIGACATFGLIVRQALDGIRHGHYDAAIIGTVDVTPPASLVSAFNAARVLAFGVEVGTPLCSMRGTHVAGGGCTWILGAEEVFEKLGVKSLGIEVLGAGLSSDAEHIITPSAQGPKLSISDAFAHAGVEPADIKTWDMHATGTPGDWSEFSVIEDFVPLDAVITARKGIFGHGMSSCGAWELTAQVFGFRKEGTSYIVPPSGIPEASVHGSIIKLGRRIAMDKPVTISASKDGVVCGKLSMGIGGISSCVLTRVLL
jgi:3-oxoacyl-(acyl-carrier-protein) synthase